MQRKIESWFVRRMRICAAILCLIGALGLRADEVLRTDDRYAATIAFDGREVLRFQRTLPVGTKLASESACYFHPVHTPNGVVVTDLAPSDHPHHRGIFLAFVEMHGKKDADFWGWGQYAPKDNRKIVNRDVVQTKGNGGFRAHDVWMADGEKTLDEELNVSATHDGTATVIDLEYALTPTADTTLSRWAFGGFCVRVPKEKKPVASGPKGRVGLPLPNHMKPETDWPDAKWYDYTFADGSAGVAVINSSRNPATLWHNQSAIGMLNPCITAPAAVTLKAGVPLLLRYRVVAHDGEVSREQMDRLAKDF